MIAMDNSNAVDDPTRKTNLPPWLEVMMQADMEKSLVSDYVKAQTELREARIRHVATAKALAASCVPTALDNLVNESEGRYDGRPIQAAESAVAVAVQRVARETAERKKYEDADAAAMAQLEKCSVALRSAFDSLVKFYSSQAK